MKLFTFFLAIYLVSLALIPCGDKKDCNLAAKQGISAIASETHSKKAHAEETCTPFCICSCCSISMNAAIAVIYISIPSEKVDNTIAFTKTYPLGSQLSVWQPPKIG